MEKATKVVMIHNGAGAIYKTTASHSKRQIFAAGVVYELEDGRKIAQTIKRDRKKDVVAELAALPSAPRYETMYEERNGYALISTTMSLTSLL